MMRELDRNEMKTQFMRDSDIRLKKRFRINHIGSAQNADEKIAKGILIMSKMLEPLYYISFPRALFGE